MAPSRRGAAGLILIRGDLHEPLMTQSIQALLSRAGRKFRRPVVCYDHSELECQI